MNEEVQAQFAKIAQMMGMDPKEFEQAIGMGPEQFMQFIGEIQRAYSDDEFQAWMQQFMSCLQNNDAQLVSQFLAASYNDVVQSMHNGGMIGHMSKLNNMCPPGSSIAYAKNGKKICKRCEDKKKVKKAENGMDVEGPFVKEVYREIPGGYEKTMYMSDYSKTGNKYMDENTFKQFSSVMDGLKSGNSEMDKLSKFADNIDKDMKKESNKAFDKLKKFFSR